MCFGSERKAGAEEYKKSEPTAYLQAWMRVSVLAAYGRANHGNVFMESGLQMTKEILKIATAKEEAAPSAIAVEPYRMPSLHV